MSGKVLIVDDDPTVRESLRDLLERRGISAVGAASDGNEAVSMASSLEPDVIVMDRMMPGMDGVEATRRIKADQPATQVILLSAQLDADVQEQGEGLGVYCYLAKGCSDNLIADMVTRAINLKNEFAG
ncbi:MAG TPA: response regulator transcription factor [Actinomycetota bacterium]|nr:response regulator transcription factor [Actinomycetota bacterium]